MSVPLSPSNGDTISTKPTACVIGAGISGVSSAFFLAKKGYDVTVLDQRANVAEGATGSAAGVLSSAPRPRLGYFHMSIMNNNLLSSVFDQVPSVKATMGKLRASLSDIDLFNAQDAGMIQTRRLGNLAEANKTLLLDFINEHASNFPLGTGELQLANDKPSSGVVKAISNQSRLLIPNRDAVPLEFTDVPRIFPPAILKPLHTHAATMLINSIVLNPTRFTRRMAEECENLGVKFQFNTRATELITNQESKTIQGIRLADGGTCNADQYVVAAGFPSAVLCADLVSTPGTLAPVVPVKSYNVDIYDKTCEDDVVDKKLPTLLPSYPSVYLSTPENDDKTKKVYTSFPSSLLIGDNMMTVENDGTDPRRFRITIGNEYEGINSIVPSEVTQSIITNLKKISPITKFSLQNIQSNTGSSNRRVLTEEERVIVGERKFYMSAPSMGLHCVTKDGLPLAGKTHDINNLYLNTGHGTDPLNTAIICGHTVAQVMKNDLNNKPAFDGIETPLDTREDAFYINPSIVDPRRFVIQDVHVQHAFDFTDYEKHSKVQAHLENQQYQQQNN